MNFWRRFIFACAVEKRKDAAHCLAFVSHGRQPRVHNGRRKLLARSSAGVSVCAFVLAKQVLEYLEGDVSVAALRVHERIQNIELFPSQPVAQRGC